jgi:hypothetical protein
LNCALLMGLIFTEMVSFRTGFSAVAVAIAGIGGREQEAGNSSERSC